MTARERVLGRVRAALADVPAAEAPEDVPVERGYRRSHLAEDPAVLREILTDRLTDYKAGVHPCRTGELPAMIARLLAERGSSWIAVPGGLPGSWLAEVPGEVSRVSEADVDLAELDHVHTVVTGCTLAVAETGTIVLDGGAGQGTRMLTLIPDHHICIVRADQVVASVPDAIAALDPSRTQTWISGPSATSDIELERVEGVHGPRVLDVVVGFER
jgi:L-lactate dehydrogenase complex protein LldG